MESPANAKILIVDDEPNNLLALESILKDIGVELVRAYSGKEALRHLLKDDFAVILLDVQMPGMDGLETAAMIRERALSRYTPIVFLTAAGRTETEISRGYEMGAVDYLLKPIIPEILRQKVRVLVDLFRMNMEIKRLNFELKESNMDLERR
ncbi:MAG TPA: response regulator, partial [bacterium]|nr:response regulator [bacterium]